MKLAEIPFNISIMQPKAELLRTMNETKSLEIFEPGTNNLKSDGLFSIESFGPLGSDARDQRFSYIKLNTTVFHPLIFKRLGVLKKLYNEICFGQRFAVFNEETGDFEPASEVDGDTGFAFFVKHFDKLRLKQTDSSVRNMRIRLIEENKEKALTDVILVMPAGLRDIQVDNATGRTTEDEINKTYRSIIATASTISTSEISKNDPIINVSRSNLQKRFQEVYDQIFGMLSGKQGLPLGRWATRKIMNGTANVISPMDVSVSNLRSKRTPRINDIQSGMAQMLKGALPKAIYHIRNGFLGQVLGQDPSAEITLTNPKTLKAVSVKPNPADFEAWSTIEGLERQIEKYVRREYRQRPIKINGMFLGLVYAGKEGFKFFQDIDELPESFDKSQVYPINMTTLFYISGYNDWNTLAGVLTRYPVSGPGSTFIGNVYVKTTTKSSIKAELGDDWKPKGVGFFAPHFPDQDPKATFVETLSPNPTRIGGLGADFDGDRCTLTILYGDKSLAQFEMLKRKKEWYLNASGRLRLTAGIDNVKLVLRNITGGPND